MTAPKKSNKVLSRAENGQIIDHSKYIKTYRHHVLRVIRSIESGTVTVEDLAKLRNFVQMSLALMEHAPMTQIQQAWRHVEILAFAQEQVEELEDYVSVAGPTEFQQKHIEGSPIKYPSTVKKG